MARFELLLMRHGEAEDYADGGDALRALTERGQAMASRAGTMLQRCNLRPSHVAASPFLRAQQTAEGVLTAARQGVSIAQEPRLVPASSAALAVQALLDTARTSGASRLLAVGHNPCITAMLGRLVGGPSSFAVSTGDLAHLSVDPADGASVLLGYIPARVLEALFPG